MKANPDDQLSEHGLARGFPIVIVQFLVVIAVLGVLVWFWFDQAPLEEPETASETQPTMSHSMVAETQPAPDIPRQRVVQPEIAPVTDIDSSEPPPPAQIDGDAQLRETLAQAGADARLLEFFSEQRPVEVSAALIDGLGWGTMLRKILPASPPAQVFAVESRDDQLFISPASYARYDVYADSIDALDVSVLVRGFHILRPVYEKTYVALGLDPEDFDNAVMRALDGVLATPEIDNPVALKREKVLYQYADPALENLPDLQKQLLRMGPDNLRRVKVKAQLLRSALLAQ